MYKRIYIVALFFLLCQLVSAQNKDDLKKQRDALLSEIKYSNKLISDARKAQEFTQEELAILQQQIDLRNQLIRSIRKEMGGLDTDIAKNEQAILEKEAELIRLKNEYAKLIYLAYKHNNSYDQMLYIFASDDFYQAWMRLRHLKDVAAYREGQGDEIQATKALLAKKNKDLEIQRKEKVVLLQEQKIEQASLDKDRKIKRESLAALRDKEKDLKKDVQDKEKKQRQLNKKIEELIAAEIKASQKGKPKGDFSLTPEEALSSQSFAQNKGKLPWPVEKGVRISSFGTHAHPVLPGIEITNNGIDISTEQNAMVRSIFEGEISGIIEIPGSGMAVVIKHGGYRTVYSNLKEVLVSKGQSIGTKQSIGLLLPEGNGSKCHVEIWQVTSSGMRKLDPAIWLAR
jgi:septal ring factor EnvC (AmiA/AmiB activator)